MKKLAFLLLEIFIGISLFGLLLFVGIDKFKMRINTMPTYTVSFNDVDGLNVGSPVRLMGIQVGHITRLELFDSKIYVTFRITKKNTSIPGNSMANIKFSGLVGSKSLEIMPPTQKNSTNKNIIYSIEPVRINNILQVETTLFENISEFCQGMLTFLTKNTIDNTKKNVHTTSKYLEESNQSLDETLKVIKESGTDVIKKSKDIKDFMGEQNKNLYHTYESINKISNNKNLEENLNNINQTAKKISASMEPEIAGEKVSKITDNINNLNSTVKDFNRKINKVKNREVQYVSDLNASLKKTSDNLQKFVDSVDAKLKPAQSDK